ncbi:MAG: hypothetical protein J4F49_10250 [Rhodobacteraceae bacterium]|nr:hypothetical protein [Paracoccaceae bacterium]
MLRQTAAAEFSFMDGRIGFMPVGMHEASIWGNRGWLEMENPDDRQNADDVLPAMRGGLSADWTTLRRGVAMNMHRMDLIWVAETSMPDTPSGTS